MSVFDRLTLTAAEAASRTMGPRAGLRAIRAVVDRLADSDRARALLLGLEYATELGDRRALEELIARWRVQSGEHFTEVAPRCVALARISWPHALNLAEAEAARRPEDARSHYLLGRLRGSDGLGDLRRAQRLAERPPRQRELLRAIEERLAWLGAPPEGFDRGELAARARLGKARADLAQGGRYARVAALDVLLELAEGPSHREVLAIAAGHAERAELTLIELDRLRTLFGKLESPAIRARALAWLDTREALGRGELPPPELTRTHELALHAQAALERGAPPAADSPLADSVVGAAYGIVARATADDPGLGPAAEALAERHEEITKGSAPLVAAAALAADAAPEAGEALARRVLELPRVTARGWLRLAAAVRDPLLREKALARAVEAREPGAERAQALAARSDAWRAMRAGDEAGARGRLKLARRALKAKSKR